MGSLSRFFDSLLKGGSEGDRKVFGLQMLLLLLLSVLLHVGFEGLRSWRMRAEELDIQPALRGWDGWVWYVWLAAAPLMMRLVRAYPLVQGKILARIGMLGAWSLVIYLGVANLRYFLRLMPDHRFFGGENGWLIYVYNTFYLLPVDLLTFGCFLRLRFR